MKPALIACASLSMFLAISPCRGGEATAYLAGLQALSAGQWADALKAFTQALDADEENTDYRTARGVAATLSGQFPAAIKDLQRSLRLRADDWEAKLWLGAAYKMSGDPATGAQYTTYGPPQAGKPERDYCIFVSMMSQSYWQASTQGRFVDPKTNRALTATEIAATEFPKAGSMFASRRQAAAPPQLAGALLDRVKANLQNKQYAAAVADLNSLLAASPEDDNLLLLHADATLALGDYSGSRAEYTRVLTTQPACAAGYIGRAQAAAHLADVARAASDLAIAVRLWAKDLSAVLREVDRALASIQVQEPAAAMARLATAAGEAGSGASLASLALAVQQAANAHRLRYDEIYQDNLRVLDEALRAAPKNPDRLAELADFLFKESDCPFEQVEPRTWPVYYRYVPQAVPQLARDGTLMPVFGARRTAREVARAGELADAALAASSRQVKALAVKGAVLIWEGQYPLARKLLETALSVKPNDPEVLHLLADALEGMAKDNLAEAAALRRLKTEKGPVFADGSYTITTTYPSAADLARAAELEKAAIEFRRLAAGHTAKCLWLTAGTALGAYYQGLLNRAAGNASQARLDFQQAVKLDPKFRNAWDQLAKVALDLKQPEEWAAAREGAVRFIHTTAGPWLAVAREPIARTQFKAAREALAAAARCDPADARIAAYSAVILAANDKPAEALGQYQVALALEAARNQLAGRDLEKPGCLPIGPAEIGLTLVLRNRAGALLFQQGQPDAANRLFAANVAFLSPVPQEKLATVVGWGDLPSTTAQTVPVPLNETYSSVKIRAQAGLEYTDWARRNPGPKDAELAWQTYNRLVVEFQITDPQPDVIQAVINLGLAELEVSKGNFARAKELLRNEGATPQPLWQEMRKVDAQARSGVGAAEEQTRQEEMRRQQQLSPADRQREGLEARKKYFHDLRQGVINSLSQSNLSERERQVLQGSVAQYDRAIADIDRKLSQLGAGGK